MAKARKPIRVKEVRESESLVSPAWAEPGREPIDDLEVMGVGRVGAPPRNTSKPGLSRRQRSRIEVEGISKLRINRPGRGGTADKLRKGASSTRARRKK